jgi:2-phospho-L-lactate guanylyltransferase
MNVSLLIPVKGFRNAKQRLSPLLGVADREILAETMFRDLLKQAVAARGLKAVYVVTGDDKVAALAAEFGAQIIREPAENGETGAVDFARIDLKNRGWEAVLIIPGDLPLVRTQDIEQILAQVPSDATAPFALLVPSHDHLGTNALLLAPPDLIKLRFGYDSFTFHMSQVTAHGLPIRFFENTAIALDIDEPKDLQRFLSYDFTEGDSTLLARALLADQDSRQTRRSGGL